MSFGESPPDPWGSIDKLLRRLFNDVARGLSPNESMTHYAMVFNYLSPGRGEPKDPAVYRQYSSLLKEFAEQVLVELMQAPSERFLESYMAAWTRYSLTTRAGSSIMAYLDRTWIKLQRNTEMEHIAYTKVLWINSWNSVVFTPLRERFVKSVLSMVEAERNGLQVNRALLKSAVETCVTLGAPSDDRLNDYSLHLYADAFEAPFLVASTEYYRSESAAFLAENSVSAYLAKAESRYAEETERVYQYLHARTLPQILKALDQTLVVEHLPQMLAKLPSFLEEDKAVDVRRLFAMVKRSITGSGIGPLREPLQAFLEQRGRGALSASVAEAVEKPEVFVQILIKQYRGAMQLVEMAFERNPGAVETMDKAFREFVNNNAVTAASAASDAAFVPQMLAKYLDAILRKGPQHIASDAEMERTQNDVMAIFQYLPDKDVFMMMYQKCLAKRLIQDLSANNDYEQSIISKLKQSHGYEYCSKLTRMMNDMSTSRDLNNTFGEWLKAKSVKLPIDFSVSVLATGQWPVEQKPTEFALPTQLASTVAHFRMFYDSQHQGRKLVYLHMQSKAEVAVMYFMKGRVRAVCSDYQLGVLLRFNTAPGDEVTYGDLAEATRLEERELKTALLSLLRVSVLDCAAGATHANWTATTVFKIVREHKSKKARIMCNVPVSLDGLKAAAVAVELPEVQRERDLKLQAAMVRLMKARRTMSFNDLMSETTAQVRKFFTPTVSSLKQAIEYLIENEYISREQSADGQATKNFTYIS